MSSMFSVIIVYMNNIDMACDKSRLPLTENYTNDELIGKYVRVLSHCTKKYGEYGKIVKINDTPTFCINVYFDTDQSVVRFSRNSLELIQV